jgi:hypothetical protein
MRAVPEFSGWGPDAKGRGQMTWTSKAKQTIWVWDNAPTRLKLAVAVFGLATIILPLVLSWYEYSFWQLVLAMILLDLCLYPTFRYIAHRETGLPIMPVLCLAFAVQYATPIFTQEPKVELVGNEIFHLENEAVIAALVLSILGVIVLQLTYYLLHHGRLSRLVPSVSLHLSEARAEIFCIAAFFVSLFADRIQRMLSQEMATQFLTFFNLIQTQLLVAIAVLSWLAFSVRRHKRHTVMLYFLVAFTALRGFSTTMIENMIVPLAVLFMSRWTYRKKFPVVSLAAIAVAFLFFSPVKMEIRKVANEEVQTGQSGSTAGRAMDWMVQSSNFWWETISGHRRLGESATSASSRTDLIHQFAEIYSLTPSTVPYQHGATYEYFAVTFIPRVFWRDKPPGNYANNFYAIAYGISNEEGIKTSSFGITLLGEGYVNLGAAGTLLTMVFLGLVVGGCEKVFGTMRAGIGGQAILLATSVAFLNGIGTSTELLFGGLVQSLISCTVILLWFRRPADRVVLHSGQTIGEQALNA